MSPAEEAVKKVLDELKGRGGFDAFWPHSDPETAEEIEKTLTEIVAEVFTKAVKVPEPDPEAGDAQAKLDNALGYCERMMSPSWLTDAANRGTFAYEVYKRLLGIDK